MSFRPLGQQGVTTWTTLNYLHPRSLSVVGGLGGLGGGHPHTILFNMTHAKALSLFQTTGTTGGDNLDNFKLFASAFVVRCRRIRRIRRRASAHYMTHAKSLSFFSLAYLTSISMLLWRFRMKGPALSGGQVE